MLVSPRAYMAGLGQVDPKPAPAPAQPTEGLSVKGFLAMAALGAAAGAAWDSTRFAGTPEAKDLAPAAGVGSLVGLGLAAAWHFGAKRIGSLAASVAPPSTPPAAPVVSATQAPATA